MFVTLISLPSFQIAETYANALEPLFYAFNIEQDLMGNWLLYAYSDTKITESTFSKHLAFFDLPPCSFTQKPIAETNWLQESLASFQPQTIPPFYIYPSHHAPPQNITTTHIPIIIDAATAFGSGEHPTTQGCLQLLAYLHQQQITPPHHILDLGCGSGILAIAAHKLWHTRALATDIDIEAINVTHHHIQLNKAEAFVTAQHNISETGDNLNHTFPLIIANILLNPLKTLLSFFQQHSTPKGYLILSGIYTHQHQELLNTYTPHFTLVHHIMIKEWSALLLQNIE